MSEQVKATAVIDAMIDGVTITDMQGRIADFNRAAIEQFGYEREEAIGKTPGELFIAEKDIPRFFEALKKLLSGKPIEASDYLVRRKDGTEFPVSVSLSLLKDTEGKPSAIVAATKDITERKRMEQEIQDKNEQLETQNEELRAANEELQATEEELRATNEELQAANEELQSVLDKLEKASSYSEGLLKSMVDGLGVLDLEGKVIDVNDALLGMLGLKKEEVLGLPLVQLLGPIVEPTEIEKISAIIGQLMAGVLVGAMEMVITAKDGTQGTLSVAPSVVRDAKGKPIMLFAVMRDISETKRLIRDLEEKTDELRASEEELRATNEELQAANEELRETQEQLIRSEKLAAIGQLAGGVGHELRNPLGAIKNAVYYIKGKVGKSELSQKEPRVMEFLDIMDDEVNSSNKIISDLLGFSRVGKLAVSPARIEKVINDAFTYTPIPENIELTKKVDADLPEVEIDTDQIRQVLVNMVTNAVQAMPEGGKLTIEARQKNGFLEMEIADTGCGIPQEAMDKIFDPLFTTKAKGIGLGLAVCKSIIDRHEGNIEVKSEVRRGTTFNIKLPLKAK